jgi:ribosomal protein S18 acetylase RimI-like enzyme
MSFVVEPFTQRDMERADIVLRRAFKTKFGRKDTLRRYLAIQSGGSFVAKKENEIVGFGGAIDFVSFAYIGLMAVDPEIQRRGAGRMILEKILEWLETRNCPTVLLDASPFGAPLYERYGFVDSDLTLVLKRGEQEKPLIGENPRNSVLTAEEFQELVAFDLPHFGADRTLLLRSYFEDDPNRFLVSRNGVGQIDGFLVAQSRVLGPWIASNSNVAEKLLLGALKHPFEDNPTVFVSGTNLEANQLLSGYGFEVQRTLRHMYKGRLIHRGRQTMIYGQATMGFG